MIWATVSCWYYFCWLYRALRTLAARNIINLISVLTIWWCPCVESPLCCWKRVIAMISAFSWQNSISLCRASFHISKPNFPVMPSVSWLPTFAFQSPIIKRTYFGVLVLKGLVDLHRTVQLQLLQHCCLGRRFRLPWYWMFCLGNLLYWLCHSLWLCESQKTVENSERDGNIRPPNVPLEKSVCRSGSNS